MGISRRRFRWTVAAGIAATLAASAGLVLAVKNGARVDQASPLAALSRLAGGPPERCVFAGPDRQLCGWRVKGRLLRASPGEAATWSRAAVLLCEVSLAGAAVRQPECQIHASAEPGGPEATPPAVSAAPPGPAGGESGRRPSLAVEGLARARTVSELSHYLGDLPQRCSTGAGDQACAWRLLPGSLGHERLAGDDWQSRAVGLHCRLPLDGSPRQADSCSLAPGAAPRPRTARQAVVRSPPSR